jgi:hypothetical protein
MFLIRQLRCVGGECFFLPLYQEHLLGILLVTCGLFEKQIADDG